MDLSYTYSACGILRLVARSFTQSWTKLFTETTLTLWQTTCLEPFFVTKFEKFSFKEEIVLIYDKYNRPGGIVDKDIAIGAWGLGSIPRPVKLYAVTNCSSSPRRICVAHAPSLVVRFGVIPRALSRFFDLILNMGKKITIYHSVCTQRLNLSRWEKALCCAPLPYVIAPWLGSAGSCYWSCENESNRQVSSCIVIGAWGLGFDSRTGQIDSRTCRQRLATVVLRSCVA